MGQRILEIGPSWHKGKEGTPTMGGIVFSTVICIISSVCILLYSRENPRYALPYIYTVIFALANAAIGFFDDMTKIRKRQNEGLSPRQKVILQVIVGAAYLAALSLSGFISTKMYIPFVGISVELSIFYYIVALTLIVGVVNCANLTDGIDGLAGSVATAISFFILCRAMATADAPLLIISAAACGGTLAFLSFNLNPARIFMGDTGSLFLGAALVGMAFLMQNPLIILVFGIVYVIEGASVIIQVTVYKLFGRRVFKMAPIHHHFEKCGLNENKIVIIFAAATALFSLIALLG